MKKRDIILVSALLVLLAACGVVCVSAMRGGDKPNSTPVASEKTDEGEEEKTDKNTDAPTNKDPEANPEDGQENGSDEESSAKENPNNAEGNAGSGSGNSGTNSSGSGSSNSSTSGSSGSGSGNSNSGNSGTSGSGSGSSSSGTLKGILSSSDTLYATSSLVTTLEYPGGMQTAQGGCVYGKYYYQAFIMTDNVSGSIIVKYDMERGAIVKTSGILSLNHTNDITYNSRLGKLVVCHNAPDRTKVSYVNPDTLEIEKTFNIGYSIFSINYNERTNRYVIGIAGGQTFRIVDSNFNDLFPSAFQPTPRTAGYTTQGCTSDDNYIYFVLWKLNVITVYNWSGQFVTLIHLDITQGMAEPENISIVNDTIYIAFNQNRKATLYRVDRLEQ